MTAVETRVDLASHCAAELSIAYKSTIRLLRASDLPFVAASLDSGVFTRTLRELALFSSPRSSLAVLPEGNNLEEFLGRVPYLEHAMVALSFGVPFKTAVPTFTPPSLASIQMAVEHLKLSPPLVLLISAEEGMDDLQREGNVEELIRRDLQVKSVALYANWRGSDNYLFGVPSLPINWPVSTFCGRKVLGCAGLPALEVPVPVLRILGSQDKFVDAPESVAVLRSFAHNNLLQQPASPQQYAVRLTDLVHSLLVRVGQEVLLRSGERELRANVVVNGVGEAFLRDSDNMQSVEEFVRRHAPSSAGDPWTCVFVTKRSARTLADLRSEFIRRQIGKELHMYVQCVCV